MPCPWLEDIKRHVRRNFSRTIPSIHRHVEMVDVTVYVTNCHQAGGGKIYILKPGEKKWRSVAKWGLDSGMCCEPALFMLPRRIPVLIRANCGPPRIYVPLIDGDRIELVAAGCYGCTDCVNKTLKRVGIVHVRVPDSHTLVAVDSHNYVYAPVKYWITLFLEPGDHVIRLNNGHEYRIVIKKGEEKVIDDTRW